MQRKQQAERKKQLFEKIKDLTAYDFEQGHQLGTVEEIKEILSAGFHIDSIIKDHI